MPDTNIKDAAVEFLTLVVSNKVREAYQRHVSPKFRHHNPWFEGDAESLMKGMEENAASNPDKSIHVQKALQDGDHVAVFSRVHHKAGDRGFAVMHVFRFEGNRIAELWDVAQEVPEKSPNEYGMF